MAKQVTRLTAEEMTVIDHLEELRHRLIVSIGAILVITLVAFFFSDYILQFLTAPSQGVASGGLKLYGFSPMDGFLIRFKVALYVGIAISFPVWAYEVLAFIAPGLTPTEKRLLVPSTVAMFVLFLLGSGFAYIMLPKMLEFMVGQYGTTLQYLPSATDYIGFITFFLLAMGAAFELPVAILLMVRLGILPPEFLKKQRKIGYFVIFVFAELVTPVSDPFIAPTMVFIPMAILFEISIYLSRYMRPESSKSVAVAN